MVMPLYFDCLHFCCLNLEDSMMLNLTSLAYIGKPGDLTEVGTNDLLQVTNQPLYLNNHMTT